MQLSNFTVYKFMIRITIAVIAHITNEMVHSHISCTLTALLPCTAKINSPIVAVDCTREPNTIKTNAHSFMNIHSTRRQCSLWSGYAVAFGCCYFYFSTVNWRVAMVTGSASVVCATMSTFRKKNTKYYIYSYEFVQQA